MSDVGLGNLNTSALSPTTSPLLPATQGVDASATDLSLRAIRHVESVWALPALPDAVKLDLASLPGGHPAVSSLLSGINQDLNGNNVDPSALPMTPDLTMVSSVAQYNPQARSTFDDARVFLASLRTQKPPSEPDDFAVQKWKENAIQQGYLPAPDNGVIDGKWDTSYNTIKSQMAYDAVNKQYSGEHAMAVPIKSVLETIGDWTSPSGLLRGATSLGLWFDTGQISKDFSSWGDKWRALGHASGPLDFAGKLLDAVTGPVDDVLVPIVNIALLFSGVGEVMDFARAGMWAAHGLEAGEAAVDAGKIYRSTNGIQKFWEGAKSLVSAASPAEDVASFREPSWLSSKMAASDSKIANSISQGDYGMDAWRNFKPVIGTKKVVQVGMRLGFANQVERNVLGYQGNGFKLGDVPGVQTAVDSVLNNSVAPWAEVLFTPNHIFEPGSFTSNAKSLGSFALRHLGSASGRAVIGGVAGLGYGAYEGSDAGQLVKDAAIGAVAGAALPAIGKGMGLLGHAPVINHLPGFDMIGNIGDFLSKTSFAPITNDQRFTDVFHQGMLGHLNNTVSKAVGDVDKAAAADKLQQYQSTFDKGGFTAAFSQANMGGDTELAGAGMLHTTVAFAIDHTAKLEAGAESGANFQRKYDLVRSKLTAQVRTFNIQGGDTLEDVVMAATTRASNSPWENARAYSQMMRDITEGADSETLIRRTAELANHQNMMASDTVRQLTSAENIPELANTPNLGEWMKQTPDQRVGGLQNYVQDVMPTFGNFPKWHLVTSDLDSLVKGGLMTDAKFAQAVGWEGQAKNLLTEFDDIPAAEGAQQFTKQIFQHLITDPDANPATWAQKARFAPLARQLNSWIGKFGVALHDTVSKQELILAADELSSHATTLDNFERLNKKLIDVPKDLSNLDPEELEKLPGGKLPEDFPTTSPKSVWDIAGGNSFHELADAQFKQGLQAAGVGSDDIKDLQRIRRYAAHNGLTGGDFASAVDAHVKQVLSDDRWTQRFGLETQVRGKDDAILQGSDLLKAKVDQLMTASHHTAAEIDRPALLASIAEKFGENSPELRQMTTTLDHMEANGYKLVHGAEFLMPHDVMHTSGMFRDINARNSNAMTLGNFFDRVQPEVLHNQIVNAQKDSILKELQGIPEAKLNGISLKPDKDGNITDLNNVLDDVYKLVVKPAQDRSANSLLEVQHQNFLAKAAKRYATNLTPLSLQDLGLSRNYNETVSILTRKGYSDEAAHAIWTGLKKGRYADFENLGFAAFEAKMRSRNQLADSLNVLAGTKEGSGFASFMPSGKGSAIAGAAVGGYIGAHDAADSAGPNANWGDTLTGALRGAAVGAVAGKLAQPALNPLSKVADRFEASKFAHYGYMADNLAASRDHFRFVLNPFFDLKRYVHNHYLAQTSGVDELRFNQSPSALKKSLAKDLTAENATITNGTALGPIAIKDRANQKFTDIYNDFRTVARPHFDPDAVESTSQQFSRIGILGQDTTAWQASTWHQLMQVKDADGVARFNPQEAYDRVKNMYTYGTTGRSAAEQSVNFIFFPFSFQKKVVTEGAKFLADDLSRAVMLHDSYRMYHELDKEHHLGEKLKEHAPILNKLLQLNMFANGISPGRLGGINAKLFESGAGAILNLFSPQGVSIKNAADGANLSELAKSLVPAINDVHQLLQDARSQKNVLFDPSHEIAAVQARDGYKAWNDYKTGLYAALKEGGYKPGDVTSATLTKPELAPVKIDMETKRDELSKQYPGWVDSKNAAAEKNVLLASEKQMRLDAVAAGTGNVTDLQFHDLEVHIADWKDYLKKDQGITNISDADPSVYEDIQGVAREMVRMNPDFQKVWDKYYAREYGPLTAPI
jgi:hypothetical protein